MARPAPARQGFAASQLLASRMGRVPATKLAALGIAVVVVAFVSRVFVCRLVT